MTGKAKTNVLQVGLGPIGCALTQLLRERSDIHIVGAIDSDPLKVGRDLGELAGLPFLGVPVTSDIAALFRRQKVDVAVVTTTSSLVLTAEQLFQLVRCGVNVVSSCEELTYPWTTDADLAAQIDRAARENDVAVLATGVNPGFLMDYLPIVLTGICRGVRKVTVERVQDASFRRLPFQNKIGAGLTVAEFEAKVNAGTLRHVGLLESMNMIASSLGWTLDKAREVITPILADRRVVTAAAVVERGRVLGVQQTARGTIGGREVISMLFRAAIAEPDTRDRIVIDGTPQIDSCIRGGVNGDEATCAILANAIPSVMHSGAGLRTMMNVEPPHAFGGLAQFATRST